MVARRAAGRGLHSALVLVPGGGQSLSLDAETEMGPAVFIQQKPFIHSKINHWVYSADIKKSEEGGKASVTVPLC